MTRPDNEEILECAIRKMRGAGINVDHYINLATREIFDCYYDDVVSDLE